jgi:Xaa-Pro aminopeptidase
MTPMADAVFPRIELIRQRMLDLHLDGLLLFDMKNIRYLTGFTGSEGICFFRDGVGVLLVDGRYITQAQEQVRGFDVRLCRDKLSGLSEAFSDSVGMTVGFEASVLTVDMHLRLRKQLKGTTLKPLGDEVQQFRILKDGAELALISHAVDVSHRALLDTLFLVRVGMTEKEISRELEYRMKVLGAEDLSFPTIVASGPRAALPHAEPGFRKIERGDTVIIDYGAVVEGYHSDETCTFVVGHLNSDVGNAYAIVKEAHDRAIDAVKAGISCREIDHVARNCIETNGLGAYFTHGTGHGVGLDVHEAPRLAPTSETVLEKGMVVTIEPGVYLPGHWGIRIEDMVLVEQDGCRVLTKTSKEIELLN